jgi:hypothetical protein
MPCLRSVASRLTRRAAVATAAAVALLAPAVPALAGDGLAVEGSDHLRLQVEGGAPRLVAYANAGYVLRRVSPADEVETPQGKDRTGTPGFASTEDAAASAAGNEEPGGEEWIVEVSLAPLGSTAPFPPRADGSMQPAPPGPSTPGADGAARNPSATDPPARGAAGGGSEPAGTATTAAASSANPGAPGAAPQPEPPATVPEVARRVTSGATTEYAAVSAILGWMVGHLVEETPSAAQAGGAPAAQQTATQQTAAAVLARGGGDAAGIARLAVALLTAVGIEARPVHGWVVGVPEVGAPHGPHTWIEVRYPDRGWCFSDPLRTHHYVPATYVRLAAGSDGAPANKTSPRPAPAGDSPAPVGAAPAGRAAATTATAGAAWSELLERRDRRQTVDLYPAAGPGVTARKNAGEQVAGALRVVVSGAGRGSAVLAGTDSRSSRVLVGGESIFVGLRGGTYRLEIYLEGRPPLVRELELAPRQRTAVFLRNTEAARRSPTSAKPEAGEGTAEPARRGDEPRRSDVEFDMSRRTP